MKPFDELTPEDFRRHPVWEYCNDHEAESGDETLVRPAIELPVDDLSNRVVGTTLRFANGDAVDGVLGNIDLYDHTKTEHFVTLTLYRGDGNAFHLARYHDIDVATRGPIECAAFFGLELADVFPIAYDIESVAVGVPASVRRKVKAQPSRRLDDDELIRMALSG